MKKICIRTSIIKKNREQKKNDGVIVIQENDNMYYANHVEILGPSTVVYNPDSPLQIGAVVWIETDAEIVTK